uniref:Uncharacterized protein n=1 Tax=Nelumbo nucifera TaxID=4432 RepID=A0A822YQI8_NELNU|nr:TPA_asm: hypothetical protein HUJ06_005459 [Nelumbo nucifera]
MIFFEILECLGKMALFKDAGKVAEGMTVGMPGSRWEKTKELTL